MMLYVNFRNAPASGRWLSAIEWCSRRADWGKVLSIAYINRQTLPATFPLFIVWRQYQQIPYRTFIFLSVTRTLQCLPACVYS